MDKGAENSGEKGFRPKIKKPAAVLVLLVLVSVSLWFYRGYFNRDDNTIEATGTIEATTVELSSKLPGSIKTLTVRAGDKVKAGQLVAELSRSDLIAQRERDALGVLKAEAQLADLTSGARSQEISEAQAGVNMARVNLDKAAADYERLEILYSQQAISETELEKARVALDLGKNQLQSAESRVSLLESGTRPQVISAARTEVERSRAVLKATESVLEDAKIHSPLAGTVLGRNHEEGEFIQAGTSVATVADLDNLWIKVYIPTDDLPHIRLDQRVRFTVSGYDRSFEGVVEEIASRGEYTPKTIQTKKERTNVVFGVKIRIQDPAGVLKPGMPADVVIDRRPVND